MKKNLVYLSAAALLLAVGCNKENPVAVPEAGMQTIDLTLEASRGSDMTKTSISYNADNGTLDSRWAAGDKIYVYSITSGARLGELTIDASTVVNESNSKASFKGSVTGLTDLSEKVAFLYQGKQDAELTADGGLITYQMGTVNTVDGLAKWDIAWVTGNIQKSGSQYTAAVTLDNKMAFGYFTTADLATVPTAKYATSFTFNVKDATITPIKAEAGLPLPKGKFYMPLIPGDTEISCGRNFETVEGKLMVSETKQSLAFNAKKGTYYRLSKYADDPYGPVPFEKTEARQFDVLSGSQFNIGPVGGDAKYVHFTEGNLQWLGTAPGTKHWQIAPSQYDVLKSANGTQWTWKDNNYLNLEQDLDLFGWGAINDAEGFMGKADNANYKWGLNDKNLNLSDATPSSRNWADIFNNASDAADKLYSDVLTGTEYTKPAGMNKYKVLTDAEWVNLFRNHWFAPVTVTDVQWANGNNAVGIVVFPSDVTAGIEKKFKLASDKVANAFADGSDAQADFQYANNMITSATIADNGLLFLPAAGYRNGASLTFDAIGRYWSSVSSSGTNAYYVSFYAANFNAQNSVSRCNGFSVRLAVASE